ncbi:MAG: carbamoyltransferase HypF, partial [Syntrophomonadaceae bacterium]
GLTGEVLGLICDGTGWGTDGAVWGGEILRGDYSSFSRLAHLKYLPLPGGDVTARKPYRMALVYLLLALGEEGLKMADKHLPWLSTEEKEIVASRVQQRPCREISTSSCGRLFDAVAAFLGVCGINAYEGQAAVELEARADQKQKGSYGYDVVRENGLLIMDVFPMWQDMVAQIKKRTPVEVIAQRFHLTLVDMFTNTLLRLRDETGLNRVVLSGGVFHNQILLERLMQNLTNKDFYVFQHQQVPPGDGGIALGQAVIGSEVMHNVLGCAR